MNSRQLLLLFLWAGFIPMMEGCTSQAICEKEKECASDPPGEDYVQVCTVRHEGQLDALNANKEEECKELASAKVKLDACRAQLDCDDYGESDLGGNCDDELDEFEDAYEEAADEDLNGEATVVLNGPYIGFIPKDCSALD